MAIRLPYETKAGEFSEAESFLQLKGLVFVDVANSLVILTKYEAMSIGEALISEGRNTYGD